MSREGVLVGGDPRRRATRRRDLDVDDLARRVIRRRRGDRGVAVDRERDLRPTERDPGGSREVLAADRDGRTATDGRDLRRRVDLDQVGMRVEDLRERSAGTRRAGCWRRRRGRSGCRRLAWRAIVIRARSGLLEPLRHPPRWRPRRPGRRPPRKAPMSAGVGRAWPTISGLARPSERKTRTCVDARPRPGREGRRPVGHALLERRIAAVAAGARSWS